MYQILFHSTTPRGPASDPSKILRFGTGSTVCISNVAVTLQPVYSTSTYGPSNGPPLCCYAHSGSGALIRGSQQHNSPTPDAADLAFQEHQWCTYGWSIEREVEVVRVHGADSLRGLCEVHNSEMPGGVAWVSRNSKLQFGTLQTERKLRWSTAYVGEDKFNTLEQSKFCGCKPDCTSVTITCSDCFSLLLKAVTPFSFALGCCYCLAVMWLRRVLD